MKCSLRRLWFAGFLLLIVAALALMSNTKAYPGPPQTPTFVREGDPLSCDSGLTFWISNITRIEVGERGEPSYIFSGVRIEDEVAKAYLDDGMNNGDGFITASMAVGESVISEGIGTFTLLHVTVVSLPPGSHGVKGSAVFCFEPDPGFRVNPTLQQEYPPEA